MNKCLISNQKRKDSWYHGESERAEVHASHMRLLDSISGTKWSSSYHQRSTSECGPKTVACMKPKSVQLLVRHHRCPPKHH